MTTTIGEYTLPDGSFTVQTDQPLVAGEPVEVTALLETRNRDRTISECVLTAVTRYSSPGGTQQSVGFREPVTEELTVTAGVTATATTAFTVPHELPVTVGPTTTPVWVRFTTGGRRVEREEYLPVRCDPSVMSVLRPIAEQGYVVTGGWPITDRTDTDRLFAQFVRFEPTAEATTDEPIDAVIRSAPDGLTVGLLHDRPDGPLERRPATTTLAARSGETDQAVHPKHADKIETELDAIA